MTRIGVVHMDLMSKGGGESVAMTVIEALQPHYDVHLLTLSEPDLPALNDYFNTDVDGESLTVEYAGRLGPAIHERYGVQYYVLQAALLSRYARRRAEEFDVLVSTINELGLPAGAIEYVHFPFDWAVNMTEREDVFHPTIGEDSLYERLCTRVADVSADDVERNTVLANSEWTAEKFSDAYGVRPEVLHPPIDTREFRDVPWSEREEGFVTVGRVERSKRVVEMIRVIDGVRDRGHDVHLHVVGPVYDEDYFEEVEALSSRRNYVEIEGEVSRSRLVDLLCTHRYGIHGKEHEHFGMAVAEIVAGGAIPFVPSGGGQHAIVRDDPRLLYDSIDDAVEKIDAVLGDRSLQRRLGRGQREIEREFGRRRFQTRFVEAVASALDQPTPAVPAPVVTPRGASDDD